MTTSALRPLLIICLFGPLFVACADEKLDENADDLARCRAPDALDSRRSFAVTDVEILATGFSFERVLQQIINSGTSQKTPAELYHRWWDSNNPSTRAFFSDVAHCDDARVPGTEDDLFNGYSHQCPRSEGVLADASKHDPFCSGVGVGCDPYTPIGLFNRFDLAGPNDCGQYRIVYAKDPFYEGRNLIIFEAQLPNPNPDCGLAACRPVAEFWARLSAIDDPQIRRAQLEQFYFEGIEGFPPVVHYAHFQGTGAIRSNQFMSGSADQIWQLREYDVERACEPATDPLSVPQCRLDIVQTTVKDNPFGELFDANNASMSARIFQDPLDPFSFISQVAALSRPDINGLSIAIDDAFNAGESTSQAQGFGPHRDTDYDWWFGGGAHPFGDAIRNELARLGSPLAARDIVHRAEAMSCAGCHQISNHQDLGGGLTWPASLGFVHVSENRHEDCGGGACFLISDALKNTFLPARQDHLKRYLELHPCGSCGTFGTTGSALRAH